MDEDRAAWRVLEQEVAYRCPGFDVVREEVKLPDGSTTDFDYVVEPEAVVILPFIEEDEVVLVEEWRQAVRRWNRGLPAGTAEPEDADLAAAARRELREETGYVPGTLTDMGAFEPANGLAAITHHYFLARDCRRDGDPAHDDDETIRVETASFSALSREAREGTLRDGRTALGVFLHAANRLDE